ncbi:MAG TPA: serine/threonine-protein kinase [Gemmatimonadaceae bacterium]
MTTQERRARIETLFDRAIDLSPGERTRWLEDECADDSDLHAEVRELLDAHERATGILDVEATRIAASLSSDADDAPPIERAGPYRLTVEIGRGGMGRVYLGYRDDAQFEQRVAVKVLHHDYSDAVVARFVAERQILASLDHPNIARLLDGGLTADGRPYCVMEFVDGEPLDVYCDRARLSIDDRLRLFCRVAEAVHHAHRNLVVHRDLKPSNILVTRRGEPKLLDFGIAKLLDPDALPNAAPTTLTGVRPMTPEYASPEQVLGRPVTTAVDVHALGLILYEILAGQRPQRRDGEPLVHLERRIVQEQPPPPSVAVVIAASAPSAAGPRAPGADTVAQVRGATAAQLHRKLSGDLDRIVLMALRKEPERRYPSAQGLADDVRRYLDGRPVRARGDSLGYRARKFTVRHRWSVAAAASVMIALSAYAATSTVQAGRIRRALEQARLEAEKTEQVTAFTMALFEMGDRLDARGDSITVRELLDLAAERAERFRTQPAAMSQMLDVIGRVHQRRGDYASAGPFLERALEVRRGHFGERHVVTAESMSHLASLLAARGQYAAAESLYRQALDAQRAVLGGEHRQIARTLHDLAIQLQLQGRLAESAALYAEVRAMQRRVFDADHPEIAAVTSSLGLLRFQADDLDEAESLQRDALQMRRRLLGGEHPDVAMSLGLLGAVLRRKGDVVAAESLYRQAISIGRRTLGDGHPDLAHHLNGLALVMRSAGRYAAADSLYRRVLEDRRRALGPEHPSIASTMYQLGALHHERGEFTAAESLLVGALEMRRRRLGASHPLVAEVEEELVRLYEGSGRPELARLLARRPEAP